jgi:hypothetical protein
MDDINLAEVDDQARKRYIPLGPGFGKMFIADSFFG